MFSIKVWVSKALDFCELRQFAQRYSEFKKVDGEFFFRNCSKPLVLKLRIWLFYAPLRALFKQKRVAGRKRIHLFLTSQISVQIDEVKIENMLLTP